MTHNLNNDDEVGFPKEDSELENVEEESFSPKDKESLIHSTFWESNKLRKYFILLCLVLIFCWWLASSIHSYLLKATEEQDYKASLYARDVLHKYWIIGTITAYHNQDRRNIIRNSWQKLYRRYNATFRFVICRPSEEYSPIIEAENNTYGDLIVLSHLEENFHTAATIKPMEFFRYLKANNMSYTYVSRIDDDGFLNVPGFWDEYLYPNLADPRRVIIARDTYPMKLQTPFPGGQFYTMSWDLMNLLIRLYDKNPIITENDDLIFGHLMTDAQEKYKLIDLFCYKAFDYNPYVSDVNRWEHMVTKSAINPHKLKKKEVYLEVASMFDENGVNVSAVDEVNSRYEHDNSKGWQLSCTQNITYRIYP
jgi:hypothetical protein